MPSSYPTSLDPITLPTFTGGVPSAALGQPTRTAAAFLTDLVDAVKAMQSAAGTSSAAGTLLLRQVDRPAAAQGVTIGSTAVVSGAPVITVTSPWGVRVTEDTTTAYYDVAGAAAGEEAVMDIDPSTGVPRLTLIGA